MRKNHNKIIIAYLIIMVLYIVIRIYLGVQKRQELSVSQEYVTEFTIGRFVVYDTPDGYQAVTNGVFSGYHSRAILSINELILK